MTELRDRLDQLVDNQTFDPLDTEDAIARGRRAVRRRRMTAIGGGAAASVVAVLAVTTGIQYLSQPDLEFGDPSGRRPATGGVSADVAHPDLVTSRAGSTHVSIEGFGWPLAGMDPVTSPGGSVELADIARLDGESMCLPMLEQAAPEVPASAWRHSGSWVDEFPSRATLPMTVEAEHDGRQYTAVCALPGDFVPDRRPELERPPSARDSQAIREQCSYLAHVDFGLWEVGAADAVSGRTVAALRSPDGHVATCVLSAEPAARSVQLSERMDPPTGEDALVYHRTGRDVVLAGRAPADATSVELRVAGSVVTRDVVDGLYAIAGAGTGRGEPTVRLTAYDEAGNELASYATTSTPGSGGSLLPADCFYSLETGNDGC